MKLNLILAIAVSLFSSTVFAQDIDLEKIDNFVSHMEHNNRGIGSVSIFKDGEEVYRRSFGQSQLSDIQYDHTTKYQVGSVTKMITATLIFKLIENNALNLDDPLSNFYAQIPNSDKITIKHLLEHSSGLGDFTIKDDSVSWLTQRVSEEDVFNEIIKQGVAFQPGEEVKYSNSGYFLLTKILEEIHDQDYARLVHDYISLPLALENFSSVTPTLENVFPSYHYTGDWQKITDFDFANVVGVGDIASTTTDLNIFLHHLFQHEILKRESVEQMKPLVSKKETFGRGLMFVPFYEHAFFGHGGKTYGTQTMASYNEKDKLGFSYAFNGERFPHNDFAIGVLSIIYGKDYSFPNFETITLRPEELDQFLGTYSSPGFPLKLTITKDGHTLKGQGTGQPAFPLECYEINKFKFEPAKLTLEFIPQENRMILNQRGMKVDMKKE